MAEHRLIKMIDQLEGIKKSINKTGGMIHHRGRPKKTCNCGGILEGGTVTGFDGAGKRRRGRPRKIHAGILEGQELLALMEQDENDESVDLVNVIDESSRT